MHLEFKNRLKAPSVLEVRILVILGSVTGKWHRTGWGAARNIL